MFVDEITKRVLVCYINQSKRKSALAQLFMGR